MKSILRFEGIGMFLFSIFLFSQLHFAWWWFVVLILAPDISMAGYLINSKAGAFCYNLVHHQGMALAIYVAGFYLQQDIMQLSGIILFGHSSLDRTLGYGLKYERGFAFTHLGTIGNTHKI